MKSSSPKKRVRSKKPSSPRAAAGRDAIDVLKRQHREVEALLARFDKAPTNEDARALAADICDKLTVHAKIEEEIFYPAAQEQEKDLVLTAEEEHLSVKRLIADLEELDAEDERLRPKVGVLKDQVAHHVDEEERALFPRVKREMSKAERATLGQELHDRTAQLQSAPSNGVSAPGRHAWPDAGTPHGPPTGSGRRGH